MTFHNEWAHRVGIYWEGMNLHPTGVLLPRHQTYVQFLHPMAAHRQPVPTLQFRDAQPAGDPSAVRRIRLDKREFSLGKGMLEFVNGVKILTHSDRHAGLIGDSGVTGIIVRNRRLFKPHQIVRFERPGGTNRLVHAQ